MDGWMDGWMDFEDGEDGGGRRERVKTRLNDAYRLFAPRFQIRQISKSDRGRVIIESLRTRGRIAHSVGALRTSKHYLPTTPHIE